MFCNRTATCRIAARLYASKSIGATEIVGKSRNHHMAATRSNPVYTYTCRTLLASHRSVRQHLVTRTVHRCGVEQSEAAAATDDSLAKQFLRATSQPFGHRRAICRTTENDPAKQNIQHQGLFYTVPGDEFTRWLSQGMQPHYYRMCKAFDEHCLMVRQQAVEMMQYLQAANYSHPVIRYVLYGRKGCGKSATLAHLMHYCGKENWMVLHVPWAASYNRYCRETQMSTFKPGRVDQPLQGAEWLSYFRHINEPLLKQLEVKTTKEYVWSKREISEEGTPLLELVDFALGRVKYTCDVMGVILREIQLQSIEKRFRTLVAIDGINAFWFKTNIKKEVDHSQRHYSQDLAMVQHWMKMIQNDWSNGAVVCTVDTNVNHEQLHGAPYYPRTLLGKEGWETLDPMVPIHIDNYTEKEVHSCLEYYLDRQWIQNTAGATEDGKKELIFLSGKNPLELYEVTRGW